MSNDKLILRSNPLVKSLSKGLQVGSLADLIRVRQESNIVLLLDCSGSMGSVMANGKSRIQGLRETVQSIQSEKQMKMIQFGSGFEPSYVETIPDDDGGTPLTQAIILAKNTGVGRAIVISDGVPDSQQTALEAARSFGGRIDVVFVGDAGEPGEIFLKRLAEATGGESFTGDLSEPKMLSSAVLGLLTDGSDSDEDDEDA